MLINHLKVAVRHLMANKSFSLITIVGLAFGISVCLGISAYLLHEYSFDRYHTHSGRLYRLFDAKNNVSPIDYRVKDVLVANFPGIENACLFQMMPRPLAVTVANKGVNVENLLSADNAFFEMLGTRVVYGNAHKLMPDLNSAVLTESTAKLLFGDEDPMGKVIDIQHRVSLRVTGVIQDYPDNSSMQPHMIVNAENEMFRFSFSCENFGDKSTYRWPFEIFVLLHEDANAGTLVGSINAHKDLLRPYEENVGLLALTDMYLHDKTLGSAMRRGNPGLLNLLIGIGFIILLLAIINYVNLTAAQHIRRCKEIGVKKSVGAGRGNIVGQFLIESVVVACISFLIAIAILAESVPVYRLILFDSYQVYQLYSYWYFIIPVVIMLGAIAGFGTAWFFSSIHPIMALKGEVSTRKGRFTWRNGLTVFQFIVSIALMSCIIVMQEQIRYVKQCNPGFAQEQLLKLDMRPMQETDKNKAYRLLDLYRHSPGIESASLTNGIPGDINTFMGTMMHGKNRSLPIIYADSAFLRTFGIHVVRGRNPMPGDYGATCLINESAYQYFEWTDLQDKRYDNGRPGGFQVIGVVNDFHYSSLRDAIGPLCILFQDELNPTHLSIRIAAGRIGETLQFIQKQWQEMFPQYPLQYEFYDTWLEAMYRQDEKLGTAIGLFGALAIVISCLGILGMAIASTQRRTKEIGVRKLVGASVWNILLMLTGSLTQWVILANIFAWPIAYYVMTTWLQEFAYRIEIQWWMFALSGVLSLLVAFLTISTQAIKAAVANPIEALRHE